MIKKNPMVLGIIVFCLLLFGGILIALSYSNQSSLSNLISQYQPGDLEKPKLEFNNQMIDFGKIKLSDIVSWEVSVKNIGTKNLILSDFTTSCGCTTIQVIDDEQKSPKFSLHNKKVWQKEIAPNSSITIKIEYIPNNMPVFGEVARTAYFRTNDPDNLELQINIKAFVEKTLN